MTAQPHLAGIVLAGGLSTRLGGGDKTLLEIAGRSILDRIVERLRPQVGVLAISANGDPSRFSSHGLPVLADSGPPGRHGPLAGIHSGLRWAKSIGCSNLVSVAGDTPFFPDSLAERLLEAAAGLPRIAFATSGGRSHPVFALWPVSLEDELAHFIDHGDRLSVLAFIHGRASVDVDFPVTTVGGKPLDPFFNINTAADLAEADAIARMLAA
ncbi:molybdenum cofactor guanylyltransferase MobA [Mesorhizobium marinum]|uniref:molybdenum cofactor guanylyltransferase MobA n=1 Tax=Mesorhizobium marinum TaxID=3228790 RepID=UPI0034676BA7